MADNLIAVLDAGSSRLRCHLFDQQARIVTSRSAEWSYRDVPGSSPFAREFDPERLWRTVCGLLAETLREARRPPAQIAAVTATSQRQAVVFLDADGDEVYAGPNLDLRAVFEGGAIDEQMRERVYQTTGHSPSFLLAPAKLRWFQTHRPDAHARIATVLTLADWLLHKLSGNLSSEPSLAAGAGMLDIHNRRWATGLLDDLRVVGNAHVPLVNAGAFAGRLDKATSRETGLPTGTPVVASGADTQCGLLGMGAADEGQVGVLAGWSAPLQMVTGRPVLQPEGRTWAGCFLTPDRWVIESTSGDVGNSYRWLADTVWSAHDDAYSMMDAEAASVPAGSEGATAFLGPQAMDMRALGLRQGGFLFPVPLTFSETGRGHLARAALEAVAYAIKGNLQQAEELAGAEATDISVGGGMTQTTTCVRILADVIGRPVSVSPTPHASALGAYLCAATAIGRYASLCAAAESARDSLETVEPDPQGSAEYQDHYRRWLQASTELQRLGP